MGDTLYNRPHWGNWIPFGRRDNWPARYDLDELVRTHPPAVDVWIEVSEGDRFAAPPSESLIRATRAPMSIAAVYVVGAGHRFDVWKSAMPRSLEWLARTEPGFGSIADHQAATPARTPHDGVDAVLRAREEGQHPV